LNEAEEAVQPALWRGADLADLEAGLGGQVLHAANRDEQRMPRWRKGPSQMGKFPLGHAKAKQKGEQAKYLRGRVERHDYAVFA
jgi:hypothetical protein